MANETAPPTEHPVLQDTTEKPISTFPSSKNPTISETTNKADDAAILLSGEDTSDQQDGHPPAVVANEKDQHVADTSAETTEASSEEDVKIIYPSGLPLGLLTFGLCMSTFVVALDNTIIATAIPKITSVFNSLDDVGWYGSSYLLTTTALQPSFGRIYTYFDVKWTYLFALCLFELGSIICAAATSSVIFIVGRAVAGAGASAIFSGGMTIVGFTVPLEKRPLYIAALSSMFGISSVIGPLLGGAFTDNIGWRWCFWINLPFGAISLVAVYFFFKPPARKQTNMTIKQKILEIDLLGALFLVTAIVCLLLALQWGGTTYAWKDSKIWGLFLGFGLLIAIFVGLQFRRGDRATIPPRILKQRTVLTACLYSCFLSMALYTHIFYLPFYFQAVKGTSAEGSGIRTIPYLGSIIISSIFAGAGITYIGWYKPFMVFGASVFTAGAGMIYTLKVTSSAGAWIGYQILAGFGAGAGVQIPFIAVQVVLSAKDMPTGNACTIFFNSLGGAISISIAQNVFSNTLAKDIPIYAPEVNVQQVISAGATYLRKVVPPASLSDVIQAYMLALKDSFVIAIAIGGLVVISACFVEWKSVKGKKIEMVGAA
ncbi:major facilitator superfamily domain-containing protein [Calycina marina]|uniref:Major facilitator superfamily domain-containing protein n=1 Tax=Calycina marina TaxID=1763456 RepID=A0A9P8CHI7_9HELO|nr:major facilitator superfamily domain-containing protein [Calycina marina]